MALQIDEIRVVGDLIKVQYDEENHVLTVSSDVNPNIIDKNFNELEDRINQLNAKVNKILFNYTTL